MNAIELAQQWLALLALVTGVVVLSAALCSAAAWMVFRAAERSSWFHLLRFYAALRWHGADYRRDLLLNALIDEVRRGRLSAGDLAQHIAGAQPPPQDTPSSDQAPTDGRQLAGRLLETP